MEQRPTIVCTTQHVSRKHPNCCPDNLQTIQFPTACFSFSLLSFQLQGGDKPPGLDFIRFKALLPGWKHIVTTNPPWLGHKTPQDCNKTATFTKGTKNWGIQISLLVKVTELNSLFNRRVLTDSDLSFIVLKLTLGSKGFLVEEGAF